MSNPTISVIIPLYNKEMSISRTVHSVLEQSKTEFELIIVDDGSTDNSLKVAKSLLDSRIRFVSQSNGGPSKARNTGINYAQGDWILFLDADDELADGTLEHLFNMTALHPNATIIDGSFIIRSTKSEKKVIFQENKTIQNNYKSFYFRETLPSTGHTLFKKDLIKAFPYNTDIRRYEDVEMIMRILKDARIVTTSKIIFSVNTTYSSASTARKSITEDYLGHLNFKGKSFWQKMSLYQFYLWERDHYPEEVDKLYPTLRWRYDLLILNKILHYLKNHHVL